MHRKFAPGLVTNMLHHGCHLCLCVGLVLQIYGIFFFCMCQRVCRCVDVGGVGVFKVILIFITAFLCCKMFCLK